MQIVRFKRFHAVGIAVLMLICLAAAPQRATAQDASSFISSLGTQGLQGPNPSIPRAQQEARFRQLLDSSFDLPAISRFVLGSYARMMSPAAQQQFEPLFRDYLAQVYVIRLNRYSNVPFRVTGSRPAGGETVVTSQVAESGGQPVQLDWHLTNHGGRWLVDDIVVGGVSMKVTQRSEFASIIQRNGGQPNTLIAVLRQQLAQSR